MNHKNAWFYVLVMERTRVSSKNYEFCGEKKFLPDNFTSQNFKNIILL